MATYTKTYSLTIGSGAPTGNTVYEAINYTDLNVDGLITNLNACHMTTRGDMVYRGASAVSRLTIGTKNKFLRSDGTDPTWAYDFNVTTGIVDDVIISDSHDLVEISSSAKAITVAVPTPVGRTGKRLVFVKTDSSSTTNIITVNCSAGNIGSATTTVVPNKQYATLAIYSNGTDWKRFAPTVAVAD